MENRKVCWLRPIAAALVALPCLADVVDVDPKAVAFQLPDQIQWRENPAAGNASAVLYGDPSKPGTVPMPVGSFVTHFGKQVYYDGAKGGDTVLQIVGEDPATATPAERKWMTPVIPRAGMRP